MSDNAFDFGADPFPESEATSIWERAADDSPAGNPTSPDWQQLCEWLPRLGTVLWTYRPTDDFLFPRARLLVQGVLLLDHPALAAFAQCMAIHVHGAITTQGPREWLQLSSETGVRLARLHILPDSDYLAWEAMLAACGIARAAPEASPPAWRAGLGHCGLKRPRQLEIAHVVRLPLLQLACLRVLGLRPPRTLSCLGAQLAQSIARHERATLTALTE